MTRIHPTADQTSRLAAIDREIEENSKARDQLWDRWSELQRERKDLFRTILAENGNPRDWVLSR